jgi:hypothetical protein
MCCVCANHVINDVLWLHVNSLYLIFKYQFALWNNVTLYSSQNSTVVSLSRKLQSQLFDNIARSSTTTVLDAAIARFAT